MTAQHAHLDENKSKIPNMPACLHMYLLCSFVPEPESNLHIFTSVVLIDEHNLRFEKKVSNYIMQRALSTTLL